MLGTLIGAGVGLGSQLIGHIAAAKERRRQQRQQQEQERKNEAWYNRRYNEDATQRADAQRALTRLHDTIVERDKAVAGRQAVMGGTEESTAAAKAANANAMAATTGDIAANADKRKDTVEQQYRATDANIAQQRINMAERKAQDIAQSVRAAGNAAASIAAAGIGDGTDASAKSAPTPAEESTENAAQQGTTIKAAPKGFDIKSEMMALHSNRDRSSGRAPKLALDIYNKYNHRASKDPYNLTADEDILRNNKKYFGANS